MRVYLTGFMGCGKTTVGTSVAAAVGWQFFDLDGEIEHRTGRAVREIFDEDGEPAFRRLEQAVLAETLELDHVIVAAGGGTLTVAANLELVGGSGFTVWLNPPFSTIMRRIGVSGKRDRPLFRDEAQAFSLFQSRLPFYRRADHIVEIRPDETPDEVAARIALWLRQQVCGT